MGTRVVDRIEQWNSRPFADGYRGLQALADREFSGLVRAGDAELYMARGVAIGLRGGDIEDFEGASGTAYEAPSPALPLLAVMQERGDEVRDSFYTEQTPIAEVDRTLSEGGFTGYVELSENVLSGDYYLVYHAGTSMSVAFVGQSGRLIDGREAFETADDEVGIYQVRPVDIEPIDLPAPEDHGTETVAGAATTPRGPQDPSDTEEPPDDTVPADREPDTTQPEPEATTARTTEADAEPDSGEEAVEAGSGAAATDTADAAPEEPTAGADSGATTDGPTRAEQGEPTDEGEAVETGSEKATTDTAETGPKGVTAGAEPGEPAEAGSAVSGTSFEVRAIPSLEPGRTERARSAADSGGSVEPGPGTTPAAAGQDQADGARPAERSRGGTATGSRPDEEQTAETETGIRVAPERVETLERRVTELERERDDLREQLADVRAERDELAATLQERTDSEVRTGQEVTPQAARSAAVVFVRYRSQGGVTLKTVHDGGGDRERLRENLRLEVYSGFEEPTVVEGQPYEAFVEDTTAYQFLEWLVADLPFEIRETGNQKALRGLYDALPQIDRADLNSAVAVASDGEESATFDLVLRDRRERPLLVANINESRNPVTRTQMEQLVTAAEQVDTAAGSLQAAVLVTRSYFDGEALELADEATKGRLLSRNKHRSFVSRSRNQGYHLCLVEAREGSPHLVMPEL